DDTTGAVAVDGGYHRPRIGRVREARSGRSGEAEAVDELAAELALPVDVGTGGHASEPDGGDDLAARDNLAGTHEDVARVVVAGLKTLGVLHADAQPADRDPAGRGHDAVLGRSDAGAIRGGDVDPGVAPPEVLRDAARDGEREPARDRGGWLWQRPGGHDRPLGLLQGGKLRAAHEDELAGSKMLRLEVETVVRHDHALVDLESRGDGFIRVALRDRVEGTLARRDPQTAVDPQCLRGVGLGDAVREGERLDRDVVEVRDRRERV